MSETQTFKDLSYAQSRIKAELQKRMLSIESPLLLKLNKNRERVSEGLDNE